MKKLGSILTNVLKDLNTSITNQKTANDNLAAATASVAGIVGANDLTVTTQLESLATLVADYRVIAEALTPTELVVSAGTVLKDGEVLTAGGRVLCATALGANVTAAQKAAYELTDKVQWDGVFSRRDIGYRAIAREKN